MENFPEITKLNFDPENILSLKEFDKFLKSNEDGVRIGHLLTPPEEGLHNFMEEWTRRIDANLLKVVKGSILYDKSFNERGFTYREFTLLFKDIEEKKYDLYPIFSVLLIPSKDYLVDYLSYYEQTYKSYLSALGHLFRVRKMVGVPFFFSKMKYEVPIHELKRHAYISGSTGSGKSQLIRLIFYRLQKLSQKNNSMSLIFIDPHGDTSKEIKRSHLNVTYKDRFILIDPELKEGYSPVINPLDVGLKNENDIVNHAQNLAIAIENMLDKDLSGNMRALLVPCLSLLIRRDGSTLFDLIKLMENDEGLISEGMKLENVVHRSLFNNFSTKFKPTKLAIVTRFYTFLNFPSFFNLINGNSTIDLKKEIDSGKVIVFNLSQTHFGEQGSPAMGRFVIAIIKSMVLARGEFRMPTFMFVDECQKFISESMIEILEETRKRGLHMIMANQSLERLGNLQDSVLSNTSVKLVGSNGSAKTLKALAKSTGSTFEELSDLKDFRFYVKTRDGQGHVLKPLDTLIKDKKYTMDEGDEASLDKYLLLKYYRDCSNNEVETKTFNKETKFDL